MSRSLPAAARPKGKAEQSRYQRRLFRRERPTPRPCSSALTRMAHSVAEAGVARTPETWLRERLASVGGPGFDAAALRQLGGGFNWSRGGLRSFDQTVVLGVLKIAPGRSHGRQLPLGREADMLVNYFGGPSDYYSCRIVDVRQFHVAQGITQRRRTDDHAAEGGVARLSARHPLAIPFWGERPDGLETVRCTRRTFQEEGLDGAPSAIPEGERVPLRLLLQA